MLNIHALATSQRRPGSTLRDKTVAKGICRNETYLEAKRSHRRRIASPTHFVNLECPQCTVYMVIRWVIQIGHSPSAATENSTSVCMQYACMQYPPPKRERTNESRFWRDDKEFAGACACDFLCLKRRRKDLQRREKYFL